MTEPDTRTSVEQPNNKPKRRWHLWGYGALAFYASEAALLWAIFGPPTASLVGQMGVVLQVLGVITVAVGIRDTRRLFQDKDTPPSGLLQRLRRFGARLIGRRPAQGGAILEAHGHAKSKSTAILHRRLETDLPLEGQVAALQRAFRRLEKDFDRSLQSLEDRLSAEAERSIGAEKRAREEQALDMDGLYRTAHTGGLDLSMFGTVCLLVGTVFGGLPGDVLDLLKWLFHLI